MGGRVSGDAHQLFCIGLAKDWFDTPGDIRAQRRDKPPALGRCLLVWPETSPPALTSLHSGVLRSLARVGQPPREKPPVITPEPPAGFWTDADNGFRGLPQRVCLKASGPISALGVVAATVAQTFSGSELLLWCGDTTGAVAIGVAIMAAALALCPTPPGPIFLLVMAGAAVFTAAIIVTRVLG